MSLRTSRRSDASPGSTWVTPAPRPRRSAAAHRGEFEYWCSSWAGALANTGRRKNLGLHEPGIDPHAIQRLFHGCPVGGTAAGPAGMKLDAAPVPGVDRSGALRGNQSHLPRRIVRPESASLAAVRAATFRHRLGRRVDVHKDRATMT